MNTQERISLAIETAKQLGLAYVTETNVSYEMARAARIQRYTVAVYINPGSNSKGDMRALRSLLCSIRLRVDPFAVWVEEQAAYCVKCS